ncbi:hypothetical protein [Sphingomonas sp. LHG3406-1]|uniref:hypothetical protein n=1 Tax=Sphingomonas sp. LHG3406-1 TaxID=2804617 RepID=UPI002627B4CE|nr:hypothetical protein [Sphingomonas sp. LHG3406-1]
MKNDMYRERTSKAWFKPLLLAALLASGGFYLYSRSASKQVDLSSKLASLTPEEQLSGRIALAQSMADFSSLRSREVSLRAKQDSLAQMSHFHSKYSGFTPLTGSTVQQMHEERNAILRREAATIGTGSDLLRATLPMLKQAEKMRLAEGQVAFADFDTAARSALSAFRKSRHVSKEERIEFERAFNRLSAPTSSPAS